MVRLHGTWLSASVAQQEKAIKIAEKVAALKLSRMPKEPTRWPEGSKLAEFSARFLKWVETARLETKSKPITVTAGVCSRHRIAGMRLDRITNDDAETLGSVAPHRTSIARYGL